jgi:hypothetical protein
MVCAVVCYAVVCYAMVCAVVCGAWHGVFCCGMLRGVMPRVRSEQAGLHVLGQSMVDP